MNVLNLVVYLGLGLAAIAAAYFAWMYYKNNFGCPTVANLTFLPTQDNVGKLQWTCNAAAIPVSYPIAIYSTQSPTTPVFTDKCNGPFTVSPLLYEYDLYSVNFPSSGTYYVTVGCAKSTTFTI